MVLLSEGNDAMTSSTLDIVEAKSLPTIELLPKDRTILEQGAMVFRPFGWMNRGKQSAISAASALER